MSYVPINGLADSNYHKALDKLYYNWIFCIPDLLENLRNGSVIIPIISKGSLSG